MLQAFSNVSGEFEIIGRIESTYKMIHFYVIWDITISTMRFDFIDIIHYVLACFLFDIEIP